MPSARHALVVVALSSLWLGAHADAQPVAVEFVASTAADQWDTRTYRSIWEESGARIVAAFEAVTCLPFTESIVPAVVAEDVSHSGGPAHPMQLRASYVREVKQSTLVHELGHRHLWQLEKRLDGVDGHQTLFLVLDRVWARVWGEKFAAQSIARESSWVASYDYGAAWTWAQSLSAAERERLWRELLALNGFAPSCSTSAATASASVVEP